MQPNFVYYSKWTSFSTLWYLWLCVPQYIRYITYNILIRFFGDCTVSAQVTRLPWGMYVKFGDQSESLLNEALTTQFVNRNTTIPVPTIFDLIQLSRDNVRPLLLMSEVPGQQLGNMPLSLDDISEPQLIKFRETIRNWVNQLRNLRRPHNINSVSSFCGGSFQSYRLSFDSRVGPYDSVETFHAQSFCKVGPQASHAIQSLAFSLRQKQYRLCLTHGDLSPNNILVDDNYNPIGLVDFQCAAWMPEYWEVTSALWRREGYTSWFSVFKGLFPDYTEEIAVEMEVWETISPW